MSLIRAIENQYFEIDRQYSIKEFDARTNGQPIRENYWKRKRELNTHAYFLFVFTRLEDHIKNESTGLIIDMRNTILNWKPRAIWDNTDEDNLHFKKRLGLLTEKNQPVYAKIVDYYRHRNTIAHGGTIPGIGTAINMIDVFADVKSYLSILTR